MGGRRMDGRAIGWIATVASTVLGLGLAAASPAVASTTFGQTHSSGGSCSPGAWRVQDLSGTSGPSYDAPSDGVITSWSTEAASGAAQQLQLQVFRETSSFHYLVVGVSQLESLTPSTTNTFSTRIPVKAGDKLASYVPTTSASVGCQFFTGDSADRYIGGGDVPTTGSTVTSNQGGTQFRLNESVVLEPDADGDGFGDETQDSCPLDPDTHAGPCPADLSVSDVASASEVTLGDTVSFTVTVKNNNLFNSASAISVNEPLSAGLEHVSATGGTCSGGSCSVGVLAPGASAIVTFVARATSAGGQAQAAIVTSPTLDPDITNNSAVVPVTVVKPASEPVVPPADDTTPPAGGGTAPPTGGTDPPAGGTVPPQPPPSGGLAPFGGVHLASTKIKVGKSGKIKIAATCPATANGNCVGTDTLTSGKSLTVGRAAFSIPAGRTVKVTIKLSRAALKLLAKKHTLKAIQTAVSHDSRNSPATTNGRITLTK